jgi:hypothetical protein
MNPKYCLDTSGFSNPLLEMPDDIHVTLWTQVVNRIETGALCWNAEIAEELKSIPGSVGAVLKKCNGSCCLEIGDDGWPWQEYLKTNEEWRQTYKLFISEYNGNRKRTVGLNDVSIVALAKTLNLPIISMEKRHTCHIPAGSMAVF